MRRLFTLLLFLPLAGCSPDGPAADTAPGEAPAAPRLPAAEAPATGPWRSAPEEGVQLREAGDTLRVETGPHVVLWREAEEPLEPPYTVRAVLHKASGRLHEGYGIVIGGDPLEAPEAEQRYTYFLVRGDGSYLVKRRVGPETPVVRPWTAHPAIHPGGEEGGQPNELEVRVGREEVAFLVNGREVARLPAAELDVRGVPGVRAAHGIRLAVAEFEAVAGVPQGEPSR